MAIIAKWNFNGSSTDALGNYNLTGTNADVSKQGKDGLCGTLAGNGLWTNDTFLDAGLANWTVMFWIKTTSTSGAFPISKSDNNYQYPCDIVSQANGKMALYLQRDNIFGINVYTNNTPVNDGKWHFISIYGEAGSATSVYIGVDGKYEQNRQTSGSPVNSGSIGASSTFDFAIGRRGQSASGYFTGSIDAIEFHNTFIGRAAIANKFAFYKGFF